MPSPWSDRAYQDAIAFAAEAHLDAGQSVPGTRLPYVVHLANVAMEVMAALAETDGLDGTLAVQCALLHDTLEDTPVTRSQLVERFGEPVAAGVSALSKNPSVGTKDAQMADSLRRIRMQPPEIAIVKLADRITNLQPPPAYWTSPRRFQYQVEAHVILDALGDRCPFLAARLRERIDDYARYVSASTTDVRHPDPARLDELHGFIGEHLVSSPDVTTIR